MHFWGKWEFSENFIFCPKPTQNNAKGDVNGGVPIPVQRYLENIQDFCHVRVKNVKKCSPVTLKGPKVSNDNNKL